MGQDDPPNYDEATLVAVPLTGLEPLKNLAAYLREVWRYHQSHLYAHLQPPAAIPWHQPGVAAPRPLPASS